MLTEILFDAIKADPDDPDINRERFFDKWIERLRGELK